MTIGQAYRRLYYLRFHKLNMEYATEVFEAEQDPELERIIRQAVATTLSYEKLRRPAYVSVRICSSEDIRELNREHRNKDAETDVLSFPLYEREDLLSSPMLELGDIVICYQRTAAQAQELSHSFHREAAFLAIHSTLHLLGYDHERSPEEDELMCQKQRSILTLLGI